ncbi:MAG: dihydrodipicolinate synthase family protein [Propionibacteriaceae bacterium]|jgi:4-hydroxy-2-oxoglutarate aldolase|nr:dihydrodipicolinate synthase family protein [Propionibacteriaceae bacterium]
MSVKLSGIVIPAVTPFDDSGRIAESLLSANLKAWGLTQVSGYMFLGSNGEFRSLSDDESLRVAQLAIAGKQDKYLILGIGRESTYQTLAFLERVAQLPEGIDFVSVLTPSYFANSMTAAALEAHFIKVADTSPIPVLLYIAPGFANQVTPTPVLIARLADHPNIVGIKDTSKTMMGDYLGAIGGREDFSIMAGSVGNLRECLAGGGTGGVVSAANYLPADCAEIYALFTAGLIGQAWEKLDEVKELASATAGKFSVAGVKACMNIVGLGGGYPRLPVLPADAADVAAMAQTLNQPRHP